MLDVLDLVVAPLAGARIEISDSYMRLKCGLQSLPSRERGLKFVPGVDKLIAELVAPLAGARIEISYISKQHTPGKCRSPRGSAD